MAFNKLRREIQGDIERLMLQPELEVDSAHLRRLFERVLAALGGPVADERVPPQGTVSEVFKEAFAGLGDAINGSGPEDISAENRLQMGTWAEVEEEAGPDAMLDGATFAQFEEDHLGVTRDIPHEPTEAEWTDIGRAPLPVGRIDI